MTDLKYRGVDMCAPESHDNPWEMYDYLRDNDPIYWDEVNGLWYAFRYDDILSISKDPETFTSSLGNRPHIPEDPSMIHQDGEAHTKQRGLVAKGFTPRAMRENEEFCQKIVDELIESFAATGKCEFVDEFSALLPARLIADMLGVDRELCPTLIRWIGEMVKGGQGPQYVTEEVNEIFGEYCEHHMEMVEAREGNTGDDDLLLRWMNAEIDGVKLEEDQLLFEHALLLAGGIETTRNALSGGLDMLAQDPEQWAYLRENVDNEAVLDTAIEEFIRWVTPFKNMFRTATKDIELRGKKIEKDQMIGLMYPAANRDPEIFPEPYKFDVRRDHKAQKHIAFGFGSHFCLGANLARLELKSALRTLLKRFATVSLAPEGRREFVQSSFTSGFVHLDLVFGAA